MEPRGEPGEVDAGKLNVIIDNEADRSCSSKALDSGSLSAASGEGSSSGSGRVGLRACSLSILVVLSSCVGKGGADG